MTRLRWEDGKLSNGAESRPCPAADLVALYTKLDARLGREWRLEDMRAVGDQLAAWLPWPITRGCRLEIAGHSALVHLPWELLRHEGAYLAAKRPAFEPVRRVDAATADTKPPEPGPHSLAVLFMAAAPQGQHPLAYEEEERRIEDALVSQDGVMLDLVVGGSVDALNDKLALLDDWAVVHLSAHGAHNPPRLALEDAFARTALTEAYDLDLHPGGQRLLVVSACASAQAEGAEKPSLAFTLADAGAAPCVIGYGAKVGDDAATQMAAQLYHHLNQAKTISRALADTRLALIRDGVDDPRGWAALRQFVTADGGGKLALPRARRTQRDIQTRRHPLRAARVSAGQMPTAPTGRFVGRRELLRETVNALGPNCCGALLTGQGGVGKSSLAAQALRRFVPHTPVELFRDFSPMALFYALRAALKGDAQAQAALSDDALAQAQDPQSPVLRLSLAQALACPAAKARPIIFVFDDLEAAMVTDAGGEYVLRDGWPMLKDEPARVLRALLTVIDETPHRALLTSRYPTRVDDGRGVDLLARLTRVSVARPTPNEQRRMIRQADRWDDHGKPRPPGYPGLTAKLQDRAAKVAGHNPRLLNRLHAALVAGADVALLDELEGYLAGSGDKPEALLDTLNNLVITQLIGLAGPNGQALLNGLTAVPVAAPVDALCAGLSCTPGDLNRLVDLTLVERLPDGLVGLPALVRPEVEACDAETAALVYGPFLDKLPTDWQPTADGNWYGPAERAEFVFEAALAAQPVRDALASAAGARHVGNLIAANQRRHARAMTDRVADLAPNPWLLARLAEAWWGTDTGRCATLVEQARAALPADPPSELAVYVLRRQAEIDLQRGAPDDALAHLRAAEPLAESKKTQAVITGEIARILTSKGKVDEALALHREEMEVYEALEDRRERAVTLGDIARILKNKGKVDEALALHREMIDVFEALEDRRSRAVTLGDIARILKNKGKVDEALALHRERLEVYEALEDRRERAVTLGDIARILTDKGKVDEALALHREEMEVYEALEDRRERAVTLGDIARILTSKGKVDEALALHREEMEVYEALEDRRSRAVTLGDIARILKNKGKVDEALALHREEMEVYEALEDRRSRAVTLGDIARILKNKGKVDEALALHREMIDVFEALEDRRSRAVTLGDIARILTSKGKVDEALALHREQIEVYEALEDRRSRAVTLGDIARILTSKGKVDEALALHRERLEVYEALEDRRERAVTLGDIARILKNKGKVDEALALHREMIDVFEALEDRRSRAVTLGDIARILKNKGKVDEALALHRERLEVYEALEDRRERAVTLGDIARILTSKGKVDEALALHRERLEVYEALEDRRSRAVTLGDIGNIYMAQGRFDDARQIKDEEIEVYRALGDVDSFAATRFEQGQIVLQSGGKSSDAAPFFGEAFLIFQRIGRVGYLAQSGLYYGLTLARSGRFAEARAPLEASRDAFRMLGNTEMLAQAEGLLAQLPPAAG